MLPAGHPFLKIVELHKKANCQSGRPLAHHFNSISARDVHDVWHWLDRKKIQLVIGSIWTGNRASVLNRKEKRSLFYCVLFCYCVRLYFTFVYVRRQKVVKNPSKRFFVIWGKEIWFSVTKELGSTYSELSCKFYGCHSIHSDKYLRKSKHSFNWTVWKLALLPWTAW